MELKKRTGLAQRPRRLTVTRKRLVDMPTLVGRAGSAQVLSVATIMVDRKEAFRNAGVLASAAEAFTVVEGEAFMAVAGAADRGSASGIGR